jgi:hypothetical protein
MPRLDNFADFALLTDQKVMTSPDTIINDTSRFRCYTFFQAWKRKKNLQGGNGIKDYIELKADKTGQWVNSNHKFDPQSSDGTVEHSCAWAEYANHMFWEADEEKCNEADRKATYKRLYNSKRIRRAQNTIDDLEASLWAAPDSLMELAIGNTTSPDKARIPYSLLSLITVNGLAPAAFGGTVMQVSPTTYPNWRNQSARFTNFANEIEDLLFDMYYNSKWDVAGSPHDGVMTGTPEDGCVAYADLGSIKTLRRILRNSNDRLTNLGQFDKGLTYLGKPIMWAEPLGNADTADASKTIVGVNWDFMFPIIRDGMFMTLMKNPQGGGPWILPLQPKARVLYEFTNLNLWCASRRRHYRISHTTAVS